MDKETYEALKLLYMNSIKPIDVDYSEQWKLIGGWIDEVSKDYNEYCEIHPNQALEIKKDGWKYCPICGE